MNKSASKSEILRVLYPSYMSGNEWEIKKRIENDENLNTCDIPTLKQRNTSSITSLY